MAPSLCISIAAVNHSEVRIQLWTFYVDHVMFVIVEFNKYTLLSTLETYRPWVDLAAYLATHMGKMWQHCTFKFEGSFLTLLAW